MCDELNGQILTFQVLKFIGQPGFIHDDSADAKEHRPYRLKESGTMPMFCFVILAQRSAES
jgi:hypothetical protein